MNFDVKHSAVKKEEEKKDEKKEDTFGYSLTDTLEQSKCFSVYFRKRID